MAPRKIGEISFDTDHIWGRGSFGVVFKGIFKNKEVAIKRIQIIDRPPSSEREENAMRKIKHEHVVSIIHSEEDVNFKYFVMELCVSSMDKLFSLESRHQSVPLPSDKVVLIQLANGLNYIHEAKFVHRDVKPSNVLITLNGTMKWSGFGVSKPTEPDGSFEYSGLRGTMQWMPPEVIKLGSVKFGSSETRDNPPKGTIKSDIFAFGLVCFYYLTRGKHPFGGLRSLETTNNIVNGKLVNIEGLRYRLFKSLV